MMHYFQSVKEVPVRIVGLDINKGAISIDFHVFQQKGVV